MQPPRSAAETGGGTQEVGGHAVRHENEPRRKSWFVFVIYPPIPLTNFSSLQRWLAKTKRHLPRIRIPDETVKPHHHDMTTTKTTQPPVTTTTTLLQ